MKNNLSFTVGPIKKSTDGLSRVCIDVYLYSCKDHLFVQELNQATGFKERHLGTIMDKACFATKSRVDKKYTVQYPLGK